MTCVWMIRLWLILRRVMFFSSRLHHSWDMVKFSVRFWSVGFFCLIGSPEGCIIFHECVSFSIEKNRTKGILIGRWVRLVKWNFLQQRLIINSSLLISIYSGIFIKTTYKSIHFRRRRGEEVECQQHPLYVKT